MALWVLALLLGSVLSFFFASIRKSVSGALRRRPALIWAVPFLLTGIFSVAAALVDGGSLPLSGLVLAYTSGPVFSTWLGRSGSVDRPSAWDFLTVLLLWLPLEFATGAALVPRPARGYLHSVAYGIAILLALPLFLGFRRTPGLKYNWPDDVRDAWLPLAGFAAAAPVLILLGVALGFIPPPHPPLQSARSMAAAVAVIFLGTALPEEILFRSLVQNLLMQRFGTGWRTLLAASFIFGCAHLNNGPQPLPNWRYLILATLAGIAYGAVFQKASTVLSSATLHMLVDWTKHVFF